MQQSEMKVLFVSVENASRSLMAEACLRHLAPQRFKAYSCGIPGQIAQQPDTWAKLAISTAGFGAQDLRCKPWTDFTRSGAPRMAIVIALDAATSREHPSWPGQPETATWTMPSLNRSTLSGQALGIAAIHNLHAIRRRIDLLISLSARAKSITDLRHDLRDLAHV